MNTKTYHDFYYGFDELITIRDIYRYALSQANQNHCFSGHGSEDLFNDLWVIIAHTLALSHADAQYFLDAKITGAEKQKLIDFLAKRILEKVPVAYLTNKAFLHGLEFYVDERVLIPRSPIAELINNKFFPWINEDNVHNILDLCTGSACLAINACYAFPHAKVDAVDLSKDALEVANINKNNHQLYEQLTLIESDLWQNVPQKKYDVIISNPPYVAAEEMLKLPQEYSHEPKMALETAEQGLKIIKDILMHAKNYLTTHGILIVEVGCALDALLAQFPDVPFMWLEFAHGGEDVFLLTYYQILEFF